MQQRLRELEPNLGVLGEIPVLLGLMGAANGTEVSTEPAPRASLGMMGDGPDQCWSVGVWRGRSVLWLSLPQPLAPGVFIVPGDLRTLPRGVCTNDLLHVR